VTLVIGLMSGTSIDGIDVAAIDTDGVDAVVPRGALTVPYDPALRERIRSVLGGSGRLAATETELTEAHARAVEQLVKKYALRDASLIGFHGHTVLHRPWERRTWQIGDGALLARLTGLDVVNDFRSADVASGGQGAPFVPLFHQALAAGIERPLAVVNIGGVANVTWLGAGDDEILAFDTGPGNALLDDWALTHTGRPVDESGALAKSGKVDEAHLARFLAHPFFAAPPPKSLDRDDFARFMPKDLSPADGAATLAAMTVCGITTARRHFPAPVAQWLVTGGGRRNPVLMAMLASHLDRPVEPVERTGWDGDALEAQAFAYLALRSVKGLPLSLPQTTGVAAPMTGGHLHRAVQRG
jgi:anhydro-N-acetylmuramic acid kinase